MALLPRRRNRMKSRVHGPILCQFRAPANGADGDHIRHIHAALPKEINGQYHVQVAWWGPQHNGLVYYEPVMAILDLKIDALYYYLNNTHRGSPGFSAWWRSICSPPAVLAMDEVIKVDGKYIKVLDVMQADRCWIYNGYGHCVIGSGKELDCMDGSILNDDIIYIANDMDIIRFTGLEAVIKDLAVNTGKDAFIGHLLGGTMRRIRVPMKSKMTAYSETFKGWRLSWLLYLRGILDGQGIEYKNTKSSISFMVNHEKAKDAFGLEVFRKENEKNWFYNENIRINIFKQTNRIRIITAILKEKKKENANGTHDIIGLDLL